MIQYRVWHNDLKGGLGLALAHPLFYCFAIATKWIPFGAFVLKVNLVSATAAAVTVANVFLLLRLRSVRVLAAVVGTLSLAVSHTFWRHACIVETYTLFTAFLSAELILLSLYCRSQQKKYLYWLALLNGLSLANHLMAVISLACYSLLFLWLLFKKHLNLKDVLSMAILWILGTLPYSVIVAGEMVVTGDIHGTIISALFGNSWQQNVLNTSLSWKIIKENVLFLGMNFPTPIFFLSVFGFVIFVKQLKIDKFAAVFVGVLFLFLVFAFRYTVPDRYAFFIPFYLCVAVCIGFGAEFVMRNRFSGWILFVFALLPIVVYIFLPTIAQRSGVRLGTSRTIPYRQEYSFFLQPWKTAYRGADTFSNAALNVVDNNACVYADGTSVYPLLLTQEIHNVRTDVKIFSSHGTIDNLDEFTNCVSSAEFPVYVVSPKSGYCSQKLLHAYEFIETYPLYMAVPKNVNIIEN